MSTSLLKPLFLSGGGDVTNASVVTAIAEDPAAVRTAANAIGYDPAAVVVVDPSGTDTQRGNALVAAYVTAKTLTPGGNALSVTNRALVVIPPGNYKLPSTLTLDTNFIDIAALVISEPSRRLATDYDEMPEFATPYYSSFRPQPTLVYSDTDYQSTITQTASNVHLNGFSVANLALGAGFITENKYLTELDWGALLIGQGCDNSASVYSNMYFWTVCTAFASVGGVRAYDNFSGTWINCVSNASSFRNGYGDKVSATAVFSAKMFNCDAGPYSFIGDYYTGTFSAENAYFERCKGAGLTWENGTSEGGMCFAGCAITAAEVKSTCIFIDCVCGEKSYGIGTTNAGTHIRCRGGASCFGATSGSAGLNAKFDGYAEDCVAGANSFGGTDIAGEGKCSGTLVRCIGEGNTVSMRLEGAVIRDSRITATTTGIHALTLLDSTSVVSNSDILVLQGGTGIPIYAATAKNVSAYHCRMNNASNDADGLGANVTNLVSSAGNVISDSVK